MIDLKEHAALVDRIGRWIGATESRLTEFGTVEYRCPACGSWKFGPTISVHELVQRAATGASIACVGCCDICERTTNPAPAAWPAPAARPATIEEAA